MMWGSSQAQIYHMRWFEQHLPKDGSVRIEPLGMKLIGLSIAGPKARELLQRLTDDDVSNAAFKFMDYREMEVATVRAKVNRITYTGDLGYEIWVAPEYQRRLYQSIMDAGADLGLKNFGMRALLCLRLEKHFGTWFREFRPIYGPFEAGLDRFVKLDKPDFIGKAAALKEKQDGPKRTRVCMVGGRDRHRRDGRRADLGRWQGRGLGHVGWLRSWRRPVAGAGLYPDRTGQAGHAAGDRDPGRAHGRRGCKPSRLSTRRRCG